MSAGRPRFLVVQWGARNHYAAPLALERAGLLEQLVTDATSTHPLARPLARVPARLRPARAERLLARELPPELLPRAVSVLRYDLQEWLSGRLGLSSGEAASAAARRLGSHGLARHAMRRAPRAANALYVHACAATEAMREARARGWFVVLEAISHPFNKRIEAAEIRRFGREPEWSDDETERNIRFFAAETELADLVLAPSEFVREGLLELGVPPERVEVVPYGLRPLPSLLEGPPRRGPARVLYLGNVSYLKGVPHLAAATRALRASGVEFECRVVGNAPPDLLRRPEFLGPDYVGPVPRSRVRREYAAADVFVFPTLADGFGFVLLEATSCGLPVVTTPNCARVVRDEVSGFVVPPGDPGALAARLESLLTDPDLRRRMGEAARREVQELSIERYVERLEAAISRRYALAGEG